MLTLIDVAQTVRARKIRLFAFHLSGSLGVIENDTDRSPDQSATYDFLLASTVGLWAYLVPFLGILRFRLKNWKFFLLPVPKRPNLVVTV